MSELVVSGLRVGIGAQEILHGVDLRVRSGEVHAVMGPNGSGKSTLAHALMGRPGYRVYEGSVTVDGLELLELPTWRRAQAGLFLALQYPIEVPGVSVEAVLGESLAAAGREPSGVAARAEQEAARIGFEHRFLARPLNVDLSGGERKRNETLQMGVLSPLFAVLDEIDSGLDVDALRLVARRIEEATNETGLGVVAITHYRRLFRELVPDRVHVVSAGRIVASGGAELVEELEASGYEAYADAGPAG